MAENESGDQQSPHDAQAANADKKDAVTKGVKRQPKFLIAVVAVYLIIFVILAMSLLLESSFCTSDQHSCSSFLNHIRITASMGAIGSVIHAGTSLGDYVGNRTFAANWFLWFLARPILGMLLAIVFYFLLQIGVVSGNSGALNPYALAAFAGLVGMFSKQATDKMSEVFQILFNSNADNNRGEKVKAANDATAQAQAENKGN